MFRSGSFFACGDGVHMPSIRTGAGRKHVRSFTVPAGAGARTRGERTRPPVSKQSSEEDKAHKLNRRLTELSETFTFSDDVVCSRSPHSLSYAKARGRLSSIFRPEGLRPADLSRFRRLEPEAGRHHYKGEPRRHLCRIYDPSDETPPIPQGRTKRRRRGGEGTKHVHLPTSPSQSKMDSSPSHYRSEARYHGNSAPEGMRIIPPSLSVLWEEDTLHRLSNETTRRLIDECPRAKERERLEGILEGKQKKPGKVVLEKSFLEPQRSMTIATVESEEGGREQSTQQQTQASEDTTSLTTGDFLMALGEGARPIRQGKGGRTIVLDNDARFEKVLQGSYPQQPVDWCRTEAEDGLGLGRSVVKGSMRWSGLPQPAKTPEELQWVCQGVEGPAATLGREVSSHCSLPATTTTRKELFNIMHEWCQRWHIHVHLKDITEASILEEMHKFSDNSRMFAIAALAVFTENHPHFSPPGKSHETLAREHTRSEDHTTQREEEEEGGGILVELVLRLCQLLEDEMEHVRVPAAVTLHCLGRENQKAECVLLAAVESQSVSERWASVQCLAVAGVAPAPVVVELIAQLMASYDHRRRERAAELLARLSAKTPLVHAMLAERLNSRGWQERRAVCQMLPRLHGGINKDQSAKLIVLAWEDLSPEVRRAAAQALGLTGQGKLIHDELKRRLSDDCETVRLDALRKLHSLHLMTSQLLPEFLACFAADHVSIRIEAIEIAGSLRLKERLVKEALQKLLQDNCWKVKAHALRALGEIGCCDDVLTDQLLWMARFEKVPGVRAETCHTIACLGLREERVVRTLKDILTVDDDPLIIREVSLALRELGCDTEYEDDMLTSICREVKRLSTQGSITHEILHSDKKGIADYVIERRTRAHPSTRDYFDEKYRRREYSDGSHPVSGRLPVVPTNSHFVNPAGREEAKQVQRSWSPDRTTIDKQLEAMRKHCSEAAVSLTSYVAS